MTGESGQNNHANPVDDRGRQPVANNHGATKAEDTSLKVPGTQGLISRHYPLHTSSHRGA